MPLVEGADPFTATWAETSLSVFPWWDMSLSRDLAARAAEQERLAVLQEQRKAAQQAGAWGRVEDVGRTKRTAHALGPDRERSGRRQGRGYNGKLTWNAAGEAPPAMLGRSGKFG